MKHFIKALLVAVLMGTLLALPTFATDVQPVHMSDITIVNKIVGDTPSSSQTFTFELSSETGAPLPAEPVVSIRGAGDVTFGDITYAEADIYEYTLTHTSERKANYILDTVQYHLLVYVVYDAQGALYVKAVYATTTEEPDVKVAELAFSHRYIEPVIIYPTPTPTAVPTATPRRWIPSVVATPTPTEAVVAPTPAANPSATPAASAQPPEGDPSQDLAETTVPLAGLFAKGESWALVNLLLCIATVAISVVLLVGYFYKRKAETDDEADAQQNGEEKTERKNKGFVRVCSLLPAIAGVILFILTEDMSAPMVLVDRWTLAMAVIALVQLVVALLSRKRDKKPDEQD